jgi:hypothetical protein
MKSPFFMKKLLFSSWFLAAIPAIIVFIFLPSVGSRYTLSVNEGVWHNNQFVYFDLNSDSVSEVISIGRGTPFWNVAIRTNEFRFYDQWNFSDSLNQSISNLTFGNFDHDKYSEIYIFSHSGDSLFLNVNEYFEQSGPKIKRIFITKISLLQDKITSLLYEAGFFDENGDGFDEFYFGIATGFGLEPRRLYYIDLLNDKVGVSGFTGVICASPSMADIDGDRKPEIFGVMGASGNYKTKVPFSDSSTWLMVFNEQLSFEFPPVEFKGFANYLTVQSYRNDTVAGYLLNHIAGGADTSVLDSRIMFYSTDGKLKRSRRSADFDNSLDLRLFVVRHKKEDRIYLFHEGFIEINDKLEILRTITLPFSSRVTLFQVDIDADGDKEFLLYSQKEEKLLIYSAGLQKYCELKFTAADTDWKFSNYQSDKHEKKLYMISGGEGYFFKLKRNNFYYLNYFMYPGVYFLLFAFILLIKKVNTAQVEQRESMKRRLLSLQLQGIKSQFDPHFTFNALNSVASLVYMDDRQAAYDYLNKFTQLIRRLLKDAERIYRDLNEELEFVTTYLDLEKLRFGEKFKYDIKIGESVTGKEQVPKLVLQTFAENAIKHGIMPRGEGGILKISVERESGYLMLIVEDNGIGRAAAAGNSTSTGKGLKLTDEFYDILNKISRKPIKLSIADLADESGNPSGTRVTVSVPVDEG